MTLDEFRRTKQWSEDISPGGEPDVRGWTYGPHHDFYIQSWEDEDANGDPDCKWYLILERDEYITPDLAMLEGMLYAWACDCCGWNPETGRCIGERHRDDGRGFCIDCGEAI